MPDNCLGNFGAIPQRRRSNFPMLRAFINGFMHHSLIYRALTCILPVLFLSNRLAAQDQLGLRTGRYAGIYGAVLNPAQPAFHPRSWEVSLGSVDFFLDNRYAFLQDASVSKVLRQDAEIALADDFSPERPPPAGTILADFVADSDRFYGVVQARVAGPAFSFRVGAHRFGAFSAGRMLASLYGFPNALSYANLTDNRQPTQVRAPLATAGMVWREIGLNYSYTHETNGGLTAVFGVSPKLLRGYEGFYGYSQRGFTYDAMRGDTVTFSQIDWEYGLTTDLATRLNNKEPFSLRGNGEGFGIDLGFMLAQPMDDDDYQWKIGVALTDIGAVRFWRLAEQHRVTTTTNEVVDGNDFADISTVSDATGKLATAFTGPNAQSLQNGDFSIRLPASLNLQADYRAAPGLYVHAMVNQRVGLLRAGLRRPNVVAVTPRYERRWFAATLPFSLQEWSQFRVGASLRLGWLTIGTDHLGSWLGQRRLRGTDLYAGLKIDGFSLSLPQKSGGKSGSKGGGRSRGSRRAVRCYKF